ncbi:hypothetical protein C8J55DRAFT_567504 [Lentinula edodes]|uniref:Uncharacterized protein n=1 Tax=Lentinula lateritia TaxID=40482 RepID=A0A9W9DDD5_9AGAR|nr:hypothetical protein C8J55DRAFT_567504 [Lentinula edodes]
MTIKKSVRWRFIWSIASPPPVIDASLPLSPEVIEALDMLHLMTRSLSEISSSQNWLSIIEPNWSIWLWLKALLCPLDAFQDAQSRISALSFNTWSRSPVSEIQLLIFNLAESPEFLEILGKIWIIDGSHSGDTNSHRFTYSFYVVNCHCRISQMVGVLESRFPVFDGKPRPDDSGCDRNVYPAASGNSKG